jgi:hypothetical protein
MVTVYDEDEDEEDDKKGKGKRKGREVTMVMGLEEAKWERLCRAWCRGSGPLGAADTEHGGQGEQTWQMKAIIAWCHWN